MGNRVVDVLVEQRGADYFVVLKSDGHELARRRFDTEAEARGFADEISEMARRRLEEIRSSGPGPSP